MKTVFKNTALALSLSLVTVTSMTGAAKAQDLFDVMEGAIVGSIVGGAIGGKSGAQTGATIGAIGGLINGADRDYYYFD